MEKVIRENILNCLSPLFGQYVENIDMCWNNNNPEAMKVWMKQIQEIMNFIDGINSGVVSTNV